MQEKSKKQADMTFPVFPKASLGTERPRSTSMMLSPIQEYNRCIIQEYLCKFAFEFFIFNTLSKSLFGAEISYVLTFIVSKLVRKELNALNKNNLIIVRKIWYCIKIFSI